MDQVDTQLGCYLLICAGVGLIFGSMAIPFSPPGFFIPSMYLMGLADVLIGAAIFVASITGRI